MDFTAEFTEEVQRTAEPIIAISLCETLSITLRRNECQFRYLIDYNRWENEWGADGLVKTPFEGVYNSAIN